MNSKPDFRNSKVGDKCYSLIFGEVEIAVVPKHIDENSHIIVIDSKGRGIIRTLDGKAGRADLTPDLYHSKPKIIEGGIPKEKKSCR